MTFTTTKIGHALRLVSRGVLLVVGLFWFVFALLSGAEELGGGLRGVARNSPNALPWLLLLLLVALTFHFERAGALAIIALSVAFAVVFDTLAHPVTFFLIPVPLVAAAAGLILASMLCPLRRRG